MDDVISRQAVKELAHNQMREKYCGIALKEQRDFYIKLADSIIDLLPSIQPATNCSEFPNNSDAISRQAAIDALEDAEDAFGYLTKDRREVLEQLPPIQPVIVPCDYAKACNEATMGKLTSAVAYYDALEELRKHGYVLVDMREVNHESN